MSDKELRYLWLMAAWECIKARRLGDAREAWRNAKAQRPPERWGTGVHIWRGGTA